MALVLPEISKLIAENNGNEIWQHFENGFSLDDIHILSTIPFIIKCAGINYFLTSDITDQNIETNDYVLLTSKKPKAADLNTGNIKVKRWLKHPLFQNITPEQIVETWLDNFKFIKENEQAGIKGLRPPQIGALYSILAHVQNPDDKAIVVMPTGTGKTETMLSTLIANCCNRLLVSVPSDSLRTQISDKFITLGLLKEFGIIDSSCVNPIVGIINHGFPNTEELQDFVSKCNVVVSTMNLLTSFSTQQKALLNNSFHISLLTRPIIQRRIHGKN